ncbi:histone-lysine N-methyltransferase SMYD3-like isoform X2 [Anneissia japonica]|uniref:histone-lysine N-methyltransferase SMYD3-like isoform X2 n=1 Tax=Anneissia japonica TaxID=1529436 RepID=UPI001425AF81|nr:histone-lysine N-methyltransferase SMYD3-like isoform X2 [Anneissia japonica]
MAASMLEVRLSKTTKARCVFAACDLKSGDEILVEEPYAISLSTYQDRCDYCFSDRNKLLRCSRCKCQNYCNTSCQRSAWVLHKNECKDLQRFSPGKPSETVLLVARLLQLSKYSKESNSSDDFPCSLSELQSNHEHFNEQRKKQFVKLLSTLKNYCGDQLPSNQELLHLFGQVTCNSFNICDPEMQSIGVGIYLKSSLLNHSCSPNCTAIFVGTTIHIRAVKAISKGEECSISYIDLMNPSHIRQRMLQEQYYFTCDCTSCQEELLDAEMGSVTCENCSGQVLRRDDTSFQACSACNTQVLPTRISEVLHIEEESRSLLEDCDSFSEKLKSKSKGQENWQNLFKLWSKLSIKQAGVLHIENVYRVRTVDKLYDVAVNLQNWTDALYLAQKVIQSYRKLYPSFHPLIGVHLLRLAKLQHFLGSFTMAIQYLQQASDIIKVTHGLQHELYKQLEEIQSNCIVEARFYSSDTQDKVN